MRTPSGSISTRCPAARTSGSSSWTTQTGACSAGTTPAISSATCGWGGGYQGFQAMLNTGDRRAREQLAKIPGFIGADLAVTTTTTKRDALARMEQQNLDTLPVVNDA